MEKYPRRVYSKPEFTALPPFIFTGAEFALIPSRDEPFGLVAVEFGRKGALGVGARVGGLGQMPGWWFTVESSTTKHMLRQFKSAIEDALASGTEQRAMMRARSAKQRFPVAKWVEDLNTLQQTAIKIHTEEKKSRSKGLFHLPRSRLPAPASTSELGMQFSHEHLLYPQSRAVSSDRLSTYEDISIEEADPPPNTEEHHTTLQRGLSLGVRSGPGHHPRASLTPEPLFSRVLEHQPPPGTPEIHEIDPDGAIDSHGELISREGPLDTEEMLVSREQAESHFRESENQLDLEIREGTTTDAFGRPLEFVDTAYGSPRGRARSRSEHLHQDRDEDSASRSPSRSRLLDAPSRSPSRSGLLDPTSLPKRGSSHHVRKRSSALDLSAIKNASTTDFSLQHVDPTFEDKNGAYYAKFEGMLDSLSAKTSEHDLCVEEFLVQSEKEWFKKMRAERLGGGARPRSRDSRLSPAPSHGWHRESMHSSRASSIAPSENGSDHLLEEADEFLLGANYQRPSLFKRWMQTRFGDWPVYSFLLALGQIMAANSYQITLLTGPQGQGGGAKLYIAGTVFIVMSCVWWIAFRTFPSKFVLSAPFAFYGLAFLFVGVAPFARLGSPRSGIQNVATGFYVAASASGSIFFALNFGDEGMFVPQISWYLRSY
jgi:alpha-1,3-glucan synthase